MADSVSSRSVMPTLDISPMTGDPPVQEVPPIEDVTMDEPASTATIATVSPESMESVSSDPITTVQSNENMHLPDESVNQNSMSVPDAGLTNVINIEPQPMEEDPVLFTISNVVSLPKSGGEVPPQLDVATHLQSKAIIQSQSIEETLAISTNVNQSSAIVTNQVPPPEADRAIAIEVNPTECPSGNDSQPLNVAADSTPVSGPFTQNMPQTARLLSFTLAGEHMESSEATKSSSSASTPVSFDGRSSTSSVNTGLDLKQPVISLHRVSHHKHSNNHSFSVGDVQEICSRCPKEVVKKHKKRAAVSLMEIGRNRLKQVLSQMTTKSDGNIKQEEQIINPDKKLPVPPTVSPAQAPTQRPQTSSADANKFTKDYSNMASALSTEVAAVRIGPHKVNHFGPVIISKNGFDMCLDGDVSSTKIAVQISPDDIRKCLAYLDVNASSIFINTVETCGTRIKDQVTPLSLGPLKFDPRSPRQNIRYVTLAFNNFNKKQIDLFRSIMKEMSSQNKKPEIAAIGGLYQEVDNVTTNSILKSVGIGNVIDIPMKKKRGVACLSVVDLQLAKRARGRPPSYAAPTTGASTSGVSSISIVQSTTTTTPAITTPTSNRITILKTPTNPGLTPIGVSPQVTVSTPQIITTPASWNVGSIVRPPTPQVSSSPAVVTTTPSTPQIRPTVCGAVTKLTLPTKIMIAGQHKGIPMKEVDFDRNGIRFWFPDSDPCSKIQACKGGVHISVKDIFKVLAYMYPSATSAIFVYLTPQFTATLGQLLRERIEFARFAHWECKAAHNPIIFLLDPNSTSLDRSLQLQQVFNLMNKNSSFSPILSMINYQVASTFLQSALPSSPASNNVSASASTPSPASAQQSPRNTNGVVSSTASSTSVTTRRSVANGLPAETREPRGGSAASNDPNSTIVIPVEGEVEGDDLVMVAEEFSLKCPYTLQIMRNPVQNKHCKHNYDRDGVTQFLKARHGKGNIRCPMVGCTNIKPLSVGDLVQNTQLKVYIEKNVAPKDIQ